MMKASKTASVDNSPVDWQALVFDPSADGLQLIERLAKRRFNTGVLADEAATYVLEQLSENDWQRCTKFKGNSKPTTFLQTLIVNLLEEFSRKRFGRPRPPTWLSRQGELWVKIWKQLCLERQPLMALIDRYQTAGLYDTQWVKEVARVIKARIPRCGEYRFEASGADGLDSQVDESRPTPDELCGYDFQLKAESELLLMMRALVQDQGSIDSFNEAAVTGVDQASDILSSKLATLRNALVLSGEEVVMLRMIFCDGLSKAATSRALGLPAHQAGLMVKSALQRIRDAIEACDLDLQTLLGKSKVLHE